MTIQNKFEIGQMVWVRTDPNQYERIVIGIIVFKGSTLYRCSLGERSDDFYDFELSEEPNVLKRLDCNSGSLN